jgi:hypothetical protein
MGPRGNVQDARDGIAGLDKDGQFKGTLAFLGMVSRYHSVFFSAEITW